MSLRVAVRIARRELRGGLKGFRVFLACLTLSIAAIAAVGSVRESIELGLAQEGATILGGDAEIKLTYRFASSDERQWMDNTAIKVSEIVDFRSMAVVDRPGGAERALTQVKGVDRAYPIYGSALLEPDMGLAVALDGRGGLAGVVMERLLVDRLGLVVGDTIRLGEQDFALMAVLMHEPDSAGATFGLGPRTIVRTADLVNSGLLQPGSLFDASYRLKLTTGTDLDALQEQAEQTSDVGGLRWRDSRNGAPGISRFVERLATFLVLVGLAGLVVGGVGVSAAVKSYLDEKVQVIATLKSLGAEGRTIFQVYLLQIAALGAFGIILGVSLGAVVPILLAPLIEAKLPVPVVSGLQLRPLAEAAIYGVLVATLFTVWPLSRTLNVRAATLFRDASLGLSGWPRWPFILFTISILVVLVGTAAAFTGQARLTIWAATGVIGVFVTLTITAFVIRRSARRLARARIFRRVTVLRFALVSAGGPGSEAMSVILALGIGLSVLAAVGQIDSNLRGAIARELPDLAPSFFVVDIQPGQLDAYRARVENDPSVSRVQSAPMLRGVISKINGRPASEVAGDHWVISGDRGITYSASKPAETKLTQGQWWPADYTGPPQISFGAKEAEEIGLQLSDTMTINVLGRDITGTITSFRDVDFSNAGMGFVLSMNPGAIAGAPHTYISTVYSKAASEAAILRDLSVAHPNITVISVRDGIARLTRVLGGIASAITYGALATLLTGVVVLVGAAAAGERARTYEAAVLKTLGATRRFILVNFMLRSALLGAGAGIVAIGAGAAAGWAVTEKVMEMEYTFEPVSAGIVVLGGIMVTLLAGLFFSLRSLNTRPSGALRDRQ